MRDSFDGVIAVALTAGLLLLGVVLRARSTLLQRSLVPACLIGGLVGFVVLSAGGVPGYAPVDFTAIAFHCFTLSFMSLALTGGGASSVRNAAPGGLWMALLWTMSLVLQGLLGLGVVLVFNALLDQPLSVYLGLIATHGFTQGPGQALAFGSLWEQGFGVEQVVAFGLVYASAGFLVAFAVGVPAARWAIRRGLNRNRDARIDDEFLRGLYRTDTTVPAGRQVTHAGSVDTLAYHLGLLGVGYLITHLYLLAMQRWLAGLAPGAIDLAPLFSHNLFFVHGLLICLGLRWLIQRCGWEAFVDADTQRRITGSAVDLMVVATLMSVEVRLLGEYAGLLLSVCLALASATALLCFGFARQLSALSPERALALFGCCTGSTGSGLLLLRILDPDLSTPVSRELAFFNVAILATSLHVLLLMVPILPSLSLGLVAGVYSATFVLGAVLVTWLSRRLNGTPRG